MGDEIGSKKDKKVTFAPDVIEPRLDSTMFFSTSLKPNLVSHTKILRLLKQNQLEVLESYLKKFDNDELNKLFCSKEGHLIISYLFSGATKDKFDFVLKNTPVGCLKNAIRQDNYAFLVGFLKEEETVERYKADSEKIRQGRTERFKWFVEIDKETETFIDKAGQTKEKYITEKIMNDFRVAISYLAGCLKPKF